MVGEFWQEFTWLNKFITFWVNSLINLHAIKECSIEYLFPKFKYSLSALIPNLNSSFLISIVLGVNLN